VNETTDLNQIRIENHDTLGWKTLSDQTSSSTDGLVTVYFRGLERRLVRHVRKARVVVGCVAWLTSKPVLRALAEVPGGVSLVVQKEDFLRPDSGNRGGWKRQLRERYGALKTPPWRFDFDDCLVSSLSTCGDPTLDAVRCVGNYNRDKKPAFPRMHNKFLVFCHVSHGCSRCCLSHEGCQAGCDEGNHEGDYPRTFVLPYAVWTGSFNMTENATRSLENALLLKDPAVVNAYYQEWAQILALSEPLDWESDWVAPEWRIGT
jgi:hypothetical protein